MRSLKLTLAYDGTAYVGWQRQENGVSIQEIVEGAFVPLLHGGNDVAAARGPTVSGAGRTDAGVHALGQVASVNLDIDLPASAVQRALNARLPPDVRVLGVVDAAPGFHARHHAVSKLYRYRMITTPVLSPFERWYAWHVPEVRDLDAMRDAAARLVGTHDFGSFQARGASVRHTVRTIHHMEIVADRSGAVTIEVDGDGFLRHMVRAIAGTLADVAGGLRPPGSIDGLLATPDRHAAGPTAPAAGLTLVTVRYGAVC